MTDCELASCSRCGHYSYHTIGVIYFVFGIKKWELCKQCYNQFTKWVKSK
jgi:hypothetical protein